jgi:hypothetical protein
MNTVLLAYVAAFAILCMYALILVVRVSRVRKKYLSRGD